MQMKRSKYFFIELLFNCFLLLISIIVCINLLSDMYFQSKINEKKSMAAIETQNIAELIKASNGNNETLLSLLQTTEVNNQINIYYDENWERCNFESKKYTLQIDCKNIENCLHHEIKVMDEEIIFNLDVVNYLGYEGR